MSDRKYALNFRTDERRKRIVDFLVPLLRVHTVTEVMELAIDELAEKYLPAEIREIVDEKPKLRIVGKR